MFEWYCDVITIYDNSPPKPEVVFLSTQETGAELVNEEEWQAIPT